MHRSDRFLNTQNTPQHFFVVTPVHFSPAVSGLGSLFTPPSQTFSSVKCVCLRNTSEGGPEYSFTPRFCVSLTFERFKKHNGRCSRFRCGLPRGGQDEHLQPGGHSLRCDGHRRNFVLPDDRQHLLLLLLRVEAPTFLSQHHQRKIDEKANDPRGLDGCLFNSPNCDPDASRATPIPPWLQQNLQGR